MHGGGVPVVGNPPTAAPTGALQATSILARRFINESLGSSVFNTSSTLACSFIGSPALGQRGVVEKVSSSEAQVSNTTGDGLPLDAGAANSVNSRQMKASEFSA